MTPDREEDAYRAIRRGSETPQPKGPRCRRCYKLVKQDGHDGYCSSDCLKSESDEVSRAALRRAVFERDKGVCAACGMDCEALREEMRMLREDFPCSMRAPMVYDARVHQLVRLGFPRRDVENGKSLWDCAHVKDRVRGGQNTLENARTLCLPHHAAETAELAGERAKRRGSTWKKRGLRGR